MKHHEKPERGEHPEALAALKRIQGSTYYEYVQPLVSAVRGKIVTGSLAGTSGFLLSFGDGSWAASYLEGHTLQYALGTGNPPPEITARLNSPEFGDASKPLQIDVPYAHESCNIASEVAKSHGQRVIGIAFGEECFNFCFPDGLELDTTIRQDCNGRKALRVFFEQW
jgi:hypothetical protein